MKQKVLLFKNKSINPKHTNVVNQINKIEHQNGIFKDKALTLQWTLYEPVNKWYRVS